MAEKKLILILLLLVYINCAKSAVSSRNGLTPEEYSNVRKSPRYLLFYDTLARRFRFEDVSSITSRSNRKSENLFNKVMDFFTGGLFTDFNPPKDRAPPRKEKKMYKPKKRPEDDNDDYDDPLDTFLDGLDNFLRIPFTNKIDSSESDETTSASSSWFNWFRGTQSTTTKKPDVSDYEETTIFDYLGEYVDASVNKKTTKRPQISSKKPGIISKRTTISPKRPTVTSKRPIATTRTTTVKPTVTKKITTTTTTTTTTRKPIVITAKPADTTAMGVIKRPLTVVISYEKPPSQLSGKPSAVLPPIRLSYAKPNKPKKTPPKKKNDCVNKNSVSNSVGSSSIASSWFPQLFGSTSAIGHQTSVKPNEGWFSFLTNFGDNDDKNESEPSESSGNWFNGFFATEHTNKASQTTSTTTTTTTTTEIPSTTKAPSSTDWFDSFLNIEEDDAAYSLQNKTDSAKKGKRKTYSGFQLLRIHLDSLIKVKSLKDIQESTQGSGLIWWTNPTLNRSADLLVPKDLIADVKDYLNGEGIEYDVIIWDLQKAIAYENPKLSKTQRLELESTRGHPMTWRRYHRYADILRYMEYLSLKYPDIVELLPLGRSSEGMPLIAAKVCLPRNNTERGTETKKKWKLRSKMKPAVWIDGGMHAREWISPAVVTWILHSLVEGEHGDGANIELLKMADWYIMPVVNPDGYEYTHTRDRLWRKTRSTYSKSNVYFNGWFPWNWGNTECLGVDLNRNWDHHWGEKGSSDDPCSDFYRGPFAFSEPETRAVSHFLMENKDQLKVYLSLHSYSQMWLLPTTHSKDSFIDEAEMLEMGKLAVNALSEPSGTRYEVGTMSDLLQPATGTSHDWAKARAGIKYSYSVKLRDSSGPHGYLLPGSQITSTAKETWEAIKAITDNI